jgi:hypothetical protein
VNGHVCPLFGGLFCICKMGPQGTRSRRSLGEQVSSTAGAAVGDPGASRREEIVWGKTQSGTGEDTPLASLKLLTRFGDSFPCPNNTRCLDVPFSSVASQVASGSGQSCSSRSTACLIWNPSQSCGQILLLLLLRLLARGLQCRPRLGSH